MSRTVIKSTPTLHGIPEGKPMSSGVRPTTQQLSLTAQFDDLARFSNSVVQHGCYEDHIQKLLKSLEECQLKYGAAQSKLKEYHKKITAMEQEKKITDKKLANVRYCLSKESIARENVTKERNALLKKFKVIKQFFLEEDTQANGVNGLSSNGQQRDRILSALNNLPQLETVVEGDSDADISGIEYDKTEDEVHSTRASIGNQSKRRASSRGNKSNRDAVVSPLKQRANESKKAKYEKELRDFDTDIPDVDMQDVAEEAVEELNQNIGDLNGVIPVSTPVSFPIQSTPNLKKRESGVSITSKVSRVDSIKRFMSEKRLEDRKHTWTRKKNFKPTEKCSHCESNIRFLGETFKCSDCLITCHPDCKSKSDRPCIPMVNRSSVKRGVKPVLADFVSTERPKVPALIYHCIKEIERRGMKEEGLYRLSGSKKEVDSLKEIILNSKTGMPSLDNYDVHSITGVVKAFLSDLRETLTTKFKWKDFVKASQAEDENDVRTMLFQAISELPEANRDTLAFMISHLQNVAEVQEMNANVGLKNIQQTMSKANLARVFAPTLIGNSYQITDRSLPDQVWEDNKKSIQVMTQLLDLPNDYWSNFLCKTSDSQDDLLTAIHETTQFEPSLRRISIGNRPFSGKVEVSGSMTPLKNNLAASETVIPRPQRQLRKLKPLF